MVLHVINLYYYALSPGTHTYSEVAQGEFVFRVILCLFPLPSYPDNKRVGRQAVNSHQISLKPHGQCCSSHLISFALEDSNH